MQIKRINNQTIIDISGHRRQLSPDQSNKTINRNGVWPNAASHTGCICCLTHWFRLGRNTDSEIRSLSGKVYTADTHITRFHLGNLSGTTVLEMGR